jgi:hypothetical protein
VDLYTLWQQGARAALIYYLQSRFPDILQFRTLDRGPLPDQIWIAPLRNQNDVGIEGEEPWLGYRGDLRRFGEVEDQGCPSVPVALREIYRFGLRLFQDAFHFLPGGPALVVENTRRVLVIADLHIGIESDLDAHGIHIPSQGRGRLDRVITCIDEGKPDLVLLLGDVKHSVPITTRQEYRELPVLLEEIRGRAPLPGGAGEP